MLAKNLAQVYKKIMNSPERRITELKLDAAEAGARSISKQYGGQLSLMAGGIWFASGAFVTDCLLHISGKAEHMSTSHQALAIAGGGLAGAVAVLRRGYKSDGTNLAEVVQWRQERKKSIEFSRQADELASWVAGPEDLSPAGEHTVEQFRAELDTELGQ